MAEHTPTPWRFVPWHIEEGPSAVRAAAGHIVCTTASDADAEFIVKAVNNHAALDKVLAIIDGELKFYQEEHDRKNLTDLGQHSFSVLRGIRKRISRAVGPSGERQ